MKPQLTAAITAAMFAATIALFYFAVQDQNELLGQTGVVYETR